MDDLGAIYMASMEVSSPCLHHIQPHTVSTGQVIMKHVQSQGGRLYVPLQGFA